MLVNTVDTTGAGNSFDAGFLSLLRVQRRPLAEAMPTLRSTGTSSEAAALEFLHEPSPVANHGGDPDAR